MTGCKGTTRDGQPCRVKPLRGRRWCFNHDPAPDTTARRNQARASGGRARGQQIGRARSAAAKRLVETPPSWWSLERTKDARSALAHVAQHVLLGELSARDANAVTQAVTALVSVLRESEIERRLDALEVAVGPRGRR